MNVPMEQAIIRSIAVNAAKGQHRAQHLFAELLGSTERNRANLHERFFGAALDYKIVWERELARREALGIADQPPPLPHPDHLVIDVRNGTARIAAQQRKKKRPIGTVSSAKRSYLRTVLPSSSKPTKVRQTRKRSMTTSA